MSTAIRKSEYFHGCVFPYQFIECVHLNKSEKEKQNVIHKFEVKVVQHDLSF